MSDDVTKRFEIHMSDERQGMYALLGQTLIALDRANRTDLANPLLEKFLYEAKDGVDVSNLCVSYLEQAGFTVT